MGVKWRVSMHDIFFVAWLLEENATEVAESGPAKAAQRSENKE